MSEEETLGTFLRKERERKKIPLSEIAEKTKVREHLLRAIEEDQFHLLPSTAYVKSFVAAYARSVGIDLAEIFPRYSDVLKGHPSTPAVVPSQKKPLPSKKTFRTFMKVVGIAGAVLLVLGIASYFLFFASPQTPPPQTPPPQAPPPQAPIEPVPQKTEVEQPPPPAPTPKVEGGASSQEEKFFPLTVKAVEKTWIRIKLNGHPEREMILNAGETVSFRAMDRIDLLVGNAGGLEITFKEKGFEKFGKSGEVVNLNFTSKGVEVKRRGRAEPPPD